MLKFLALQMKAFTVVGRGEKIVLGDPAYEVRVGGKKENKVPR